MLLYLDYFLLIWNNFGFISDIWGLGGALICLLMAFIIQLVNIKRIQDIEQIF